MKPGRPALGNLWKCKPTRDFEIWGNSFSSVYFFGLSSQLCVLSLWDEEGPHPQSTKGEKELFLGEGSRIGRAGPSQIGFFSRRKRRRIGMADIGERRGGIDCGTYAHIVKLGCGGIGLKLATRDGFSLSGFDMG